MEVSEALAKELEEAFRRSNTIIYRRGQALLAEMGISNPQFNTLLALYEFGPLTMGDLGKYLYTACSTATDLADRLEREGLVERIRDSKDRRIVRMHLLEKGRQIVEVILQERYRLLEEVLAECQPAEQQHIVNILKGLIYKLEQADRTYPVNLENVQDLKKIFSHK